MAVDVWKKGSKQAAVLVAAAAVMLSGVAGVQAEEGFDLQQFNPMPDQSRNFFSASSAEVAPHLSWSAMALFNYAHKPLVLRDADDKRVGTVIDSQSTINLLGSIGLFGIGELGLDVPVVVHQPAGDTTVAGLDVSEAGAGIGDIRLVPKVQLFNTREDARDGGAALALVGDVWLPTGQSSALQGGDLRAGLRLAFDVVAMSNVRLAANVGYLFRSSEEVLNLDVRDALTWAVASEVALTPEFRLAGEVFGKATLTSESVSFEEFPIEALVGGKYQKSGLFLEAGGGIGLVSGYGTPDFRVLVGLGYALPEAEFEEFVYVEPEPEPQPEPEPEPQPEPEPVRAPEPPPVVPEPVREPVKEVVIDRETKRIVIMEAVYFGNDSDVIEERSYGILNQVAQVLRENPELVVRVEGHTDSRGRAAHNLDLSNRRASAVRAYLIRQGIAPERLLSQGFGPNRPIADNATAEGRATNRRVEFHIVE